MEIIRNTLVLEGDVSIRGLADEMGFSSTRSVTYQLAQLEQSGCLVRDTNGKILRVNTVEEGTPRGFFSTPFGKCTVRLAVCCRGKL